MFVAPAEPSLLIVLLRVSGGSSGEENRVKQRHAVVFKVHAVVFKVQECICSNTALPSVPVLALSERPHSHFTGEKMKENSLFMGQVPPALLHCREFTARESHPLSVQDFQVEQRHRTGSVGRLQSSFVLTPQITSSQKLLWKDLVTPANTFNPPKERAPSLPSPSGSPFL